MGNISPRDYVGLEWDVKHKSWSWQTKRNTAVERLSHGRDALPASTCKVRSLTETKMDYFSRPIISLRKKTPKYKQEVLERWLSG